MRNYIIKSFNHFNIKCNISGALEDFEKGTKPSATNKDVDSAEGAANAEVWNEEFIA